MATKPTQRPQPYTVGIYVDWTGSLWREHATSPGAALDAALAKRMHNNPDEPPTSFMVTPDMANRAA